MPHWEWRCEILTENDVSHWDWRCDILTGNGGVVSSPGTRRYLTENEDVNHQEFAWFMQGDVPVPKKTGVSYENYQLKKSS